MIVTAKEKFTQFFGRYDALESRLAKLELSVNNQIGRLEKQQIKGFDDAEKDRLKWATFSTSAYTEQLDLQEQQKNLQGSFDQFINANRDAHIKIKDDLKFVIWHDLEQLRGDMQVLKDDTTLELKKIEARVTAIEKNSQSPKPITPAALTNPFEGKEFSPDIKALIQKACEVRKNPNLGTKAFDLLTDEQKDLVPDTWDVLGGIYCLNQTIGHATLTDIRGRIQRFKPSDVRDVLKKLTRSGFVSQTQLTQAQWAGHRSDPPLTHNLTPYAQQIFFPQSNDNTGMVHVAIELGFFLQILQRPRPLLYVSIKQQPGVIRFDGAIFGRASSESFKWFGCDAVNVETDEEVRAHPEQVLMNMITPFLWDIERVKMVCSKKSEAILTDLKQQLPSWLSEHVDIVVVSIPTIEGGK